MLNRERDDVVRSSRVVREESGAGEGVNGAHEMMSDIPLLQSSPVSPSRFRPVLRAFPKANEH